MPAPVLRHIVTEFSGSASIYESMKPAVSLLSMPDQTEIFIVHGEREWRTTVGALKGLLVETPRAEPRRSLK
jgi:hypothetical protein